MTQPTPRKKLRNEIRTEKLAFITPAAERAFADHGYSADDYASACGIALPAISVPMELIRQLFLEPKSFDVSSAFRLSPMDVEQPSRIEVLIRTVVGGGKAVVVSGICLDIERYAPRIPSTLGGASGASSRKASR